MNSKRKGKRGELEWAEFLRLHGFDARRGQQFRGSPDSPDVVCDALPLHWEVKRTERLEIHSSMAQAVRECGQKLPAVAHKRNRGEWLVTIRATDLIALVAAAPKPQPNDCIMQ